MTLLDHAGRGLLILSIVILGYCLMEWLDARIYQARGHDRLEALYARAGTPVDVSLQRPDIAAIRAEAARTGLIGHIEISRTGVSAIVGEGVDRVMLSRGVGHIPSTDLPGEAGNVVLAGHRDTFFAGLRDVAAGDTITLTTPGGRFLYEVNDMRVTHPADLTVLEDGDDPEITLLTCYPFQYVGPAPQRYIVRGHLAGFEIGAPETPKGREDEVSTPLRASDSEVAQSSITRNR